MAKAETIIPWLARREAVARVARHLGCTPEDAELRIVGKVKAGQIGVTSEGYEVSPLPAVWGGMIDEITNNIRLCFIDLVAVGLLPAPAEKARWSAAEAVAYLVKGVPLPWKEWQRAGATDSEIKQAEIDLGQAIREGVPAWGWHPLKRRRKRIPSDDFRDEMIEKKAFPVSVAHLPKVVVRIDGDVGTWPPSRIAEYIGPLWRAIEVDSARLRQAFPKPLRVERRMLDEAEQLYAEGGSEPAARAEESMPEPAPAVEPTPPAEPKQPAPTEKRTRPRGPKPGTVKRYASADRELFDEVHRLLSEGLSLTAATQRLAESGRVAGIGNQTSRARRLAKLFKAER